MDIIKGKVTLNETKLSIGRGGDPLLLSFFLHKVLTIVDSSLYLNDYNGSSDIIREINAVYTGKKFLICGYQALPQNSPKLDERYYAALSNLRLDNTNSIILEAISIGSSGHYTTYTLCNGGWRYYDNKATPTTSSISNAAMVSKVDEILKNKSKLVEFINIVYRHKTIGIMGGTRTKRKRNMKQKTRKSRKSQRKRR